MARNTTWSRSQQVGLVLGPALMVVILLLPTPGDLGVPGQRAAAATALVAVWWITEALPIPVTSLMPLLLLPVLGALGGKEVAQQYAADPIFLFLGGFLMAIAIERVGLHRKLALLVIRVMGTGPSRSVLGFMIASAGLSMWISNTATTLMMLPIGLAVIGALEPSLRSDRDREHLAVGLLLGIAYGASIGGIATPVGTPPNVVFLGLYGKLFEAAPAISFSQWMLTFLPITLICLPLAWLLLTRVLYPVRQIRSDGEAPMATGLPADDGPMTRDQGLVLAVFVGAVLLWLGRNDIDLGAARIPGWSNLLGAGGPMVTDGTVAIAAAITLFVLPSHREDSRSLLRWTDARDVPWGILLLFGGGFAIAHAFKATGLSAWVGGFLEQLGGLPVVLLVLIIALVVTHLTEITSNTATTNVLVPIAAAAAIPLGVHPLLIMLPVTLAASCAFMLPVATPPNAIVFGSGRLRMGHMMRAGIVLNIASAVLILGAVTLLAPRIMGFEPEELPSWAFDDADRDSADERPEQQPEHR
jgi:solute carrier family 13 (sodium-dependent dicarboxylate transporter), member 2/3/5